MACSKVFITIFNILLLLISIGILGVGVYFRVTSGFDGIVFGISMNVGLIVIGCVLSFITLSGIFAVLLSTRCLLYFYGMLMLLIVTSGEIILGVFAFIERSKMGSRLESIYESLSPALQEKIRVAYQCADSVTCANAMKPDFERYALTIGIIAFCMVPISLCVASLAFRLAHGASRSKGTEVGMKQRHS